MTEVAPTTAQLIARAEKAEKDLEAHLMIAGNLRDAAKTALKLIGLMHGSHHADKDAHLSLLAAFLRQEIKDFENWDDLPF